MATSYALVFRPRPVVLRCVDIVAYRSEAGPREPVSPFKPLMGPRELSPREILHRRRMLDQLARGEEDLEGRSLKIVHPR